MSQYKKSIEFLAGKMTFDPTSKKVSADPAKGKILVYHTLDGETHFQWRNLTSGADEIDLYVFPQDAVFEKVVKNKSRVYLLRFDSNDDKFFFWMQDSKVENDEKNCQTVNEIINFLDEEDNQEEGRIEEEEQKAPVPQSNQNQQDLLLKFTNQLQEAFKRIGQQKAEKDTPSLSEVLKSEYLNEIANDKEFQETLIPLLPEGRQTVEELRETLKSPQFLQALDNLDHALNSESGDSVLASLNLDPSSFFQNYDGSDALYKGLNKLFKK